LNRIVAPVTAAIGREREGDRWNRVEDPGCELEGRTLGGGVKREEY